MKKDMAIFVSTKYCYSWKDIYNGSNVGGERRLEEPDQGLNLKRLKIEHFYLWIIFEEVGLSWSLCRKL